LLRTLEVFLDYGANAAETARAMKIHRNTLTYRLKQIENYTQLSLNDPKTRLNLQVAVKAFRLTNGKKRGG
jgi:DNA-binding PucR family transcriptional regulator